MSVKKSRVEGARPQLGTKGDTIEVKMPALDTPSTKREMLSYTASIYDPLGIVVPAALLFKLKLQQLWLR